MLDQEVPFSGVVLGLPFHADGRPGALSKRVERLGSWILARFGVPVAFLDERLTSFAAEELRDEVGGACRDSSARRDKGLVDRLAAQVILREFLAAGCPFSRPVKPAQAPAQQPVEYSAEMSAEKPAEKTAEGPGT